MQYEFMSMGDLGDRHIFRANGRIYRLSFWTLKHWRVKFSVFYSRWYWDVSTPCISLDREIRA